MKLSIPPGRRRPDTANPYVPFAQMERYEVKREGRPVWVIPAFLASVAVAVYFALISYGIALGDPHVNVTSEYQFRVYGNAIAAIASSFACAALLVYSCAKRLLPLTGLLLLMLHALCAFLGYGAIDSYESDRHIRDAILGIKSGF